MKRPSFEESQPNLVPPLALCLYVNLLPQRAWVVPLAVFAPSAILATSSELFS
jgi:hypothetical protein